MSLWVVQCVASQNAPSGFGVWGGPEPPLTFRIYQDHYLFVCRLRDSTTVQSAFALPADLGHRGIEGCTLFVGALDDRRPLFSKGSHYVVHLSSSGIDSGKASPRHLSTTPGQRGGASRLYSRYCVRWMRDVCSGCARLARFFAGVRGPGEAASALRTAHP